MEYSIDAVANKVIMMIIVLSALIVAGGFVFYIANENVGGAFPFAAGVAMAMGLNITKVILMKFAVDAAMKRDAISSRLYLQGQYFVRLLIMLAVFVVAGLLHQNVTTETGSPAVVNLMGVVFGIFTMPVAMYSMNFFFKDELNSSHSNILNSSASAGAAQDAINEINAIGTENNENDTSDYQI
ncbi:MAG: hypothetical protein FWF79_07305 [Defluviitaleaceae bacterium]|nr:hypothetical protein [Defluviitaleaceae bacterium]